MRAYKRVLTLVSLFFLPVGCRTLEGHGTGAKDQSTVRDAQGEAFGGEEGLGWYEATRIRGLQPTKDCSAFVPEQRITVATRDVDGNATVGTIRVLSDNPGNKIYVVGDFNKWGETKTEEDRLQPVAGTPYFEGKVRALRHLMQYRLLVNGKQLVDPAATMFTTADWYEEAGLTPSAPHLRSLFWDFDRPGHYNMQTASVDLRERAQIIAESEVFELSRKWKSTTEANQTGPKVRHDTYRFVANSGLIEELKKSGYNAIEFLPFNTSMDGDQWKYRYQVYGLFAPDSRYGNPDEFAMMIDAFNKAGIAVIMDAVVGHYPLRGNDGVRDIDAVGVHNWWKPDGNRLYGGPPSPDAQDARQSPWNTNRYDYANKYIRRFLTDSVLHMVCRYGISGIRFDNLDGIKDYAGPGGGGPEFLKELVKELREVRPESILIGEMFFGNNDVTRRMDKGGFGFNMRTHSDYFDFIKDNMLNPTENIAIDRVKDAIRKPWGWKEAPRVQYVTNHDEAANGRGGATGKYVATLLGGGGPNWYYVEKKTMAFGSLTMLSATAYLDMPQMRLLQEGSFDANSEVDWSLLKEGSQRQVYTYFADLSNLIKDRPAFAMNNFHPDIENHVDTFAGWRIVSLFRRENDNGLLSRKLYGVVNLGHVGISNYEFGLDVEGDMKVLIDSDDKKYGGTGELKKRQPSLVLKVEGGPLHGKPRSVTIPYLAPYATVVIEQQ